MPVNIMTSPPFYAYSRNPIPVVLKSNDYKSLYSGELSNAQLSINGPCSSGQTFKISWGITSVTFTFADSPNNDGDQLPSGDGSYNYVESLIPYLESNLYIDRDYILQYLAGTGIITLQSRVAGVQYNFNGPQTGVPVSIYYTPGTDNDLLPNFRHFFQIWRKEITDVRLYSNNLQLDYPVDGTTTKDLSDILSTSMDYDIPDLITIWQPCSKSYMEYYFKYAQMYGDSPTVKRITKSGSYFAYLGGYSEAALNVIKDTDHLQNYLLANQVNYQNQQWFESYPSDNIRLKTNSPAFLYFINNRSVDETFAVKIVAYFDNGSSITFIKSGGLLPSYHKVAINCGYEALGLNYYANTTRKVMRYTVQLVESASGDPRTVLKTYLVDHSYEPYTRYILFGDSSGNFKVLRLFGKLTTTAEVTDNVATRFEDQSTPALGNITRYDVMYTETFKNNTGYIYSRDDFDNLIEAIISKKVFRIIDDVLIPIKITTEKFPFSADAVNLNGFELEYELDYLEKNYTGSTNALKVPQLNKPQPAQPELPSGSNVGTGFPYTLPIKLS